MAKRTVGRAGGDAAGSKAGRAEIEWEEDLKILTRAFTRIRDADLRRAALDLICAIADAQDYPARSARD
jgi:hypothetical protein